MSIVVIFVVLVGGLVSAADTLQPKVAGVSRPNYGVDFNFVFQLNNMHGTWKHVWEIDLSLLNRQAPPIVDVECEADMDNMCTVENRFLHTTIEGLWKSIQSSAARHSWVSDPQVLATLNRQGGRGKRSLLPFIGDIEKALFGVATDADISAIHQTLDDITKLGKASAHEITNLGQNLASLSRIVDGDIKNSKKAMDVIRASFTNVTSQLNAKMQDLAAWDNLQGGRIDQVEASMARQWIILGRALQMTNDARDVALADEQLLVAIQTILQGMIPISLIPPKAVTQGLETALQGIIKLFPGARLSYPSSAIGYYYTHKIITPVFSPDKISLIADIPVDLDQQILNVYAIRTFPVPLLPYNPYLKAVNVDSRATTAVSELQKRHDFFLVSQDGLFYSYAESYDIALCKGSTVRYCQKQFPLYDIKQSSCLQLLWEDAPFSDILSNCPYELSHQAHATHVDTFVQVIPLSFGRWYINAPLVGKWTVVCPERPPEVRSPCTSCIIQVDCGCGINSDFFRIPTRFSSCQDVFSPLSHNFSINPFGYLENKKPWVVNLTGTSSSPSHFLHLPDITIPNSENWDDVMESMDRKTYDLNRLYVKQNNETKMYRTESDAIIDRISIQDHAMQALAQWPTWMIGLAFFLSFANTGTLIAMICCLLARGARATPITDRFSSEPLLNEAEDPALLPIEVLTFILVSINTLILILLAWPIVVNWLRTRRWYRNFRRMPLFVDAIGYEHKEGGTTVLMTCNAIFISSLSQRVIPLSIRLACIPAGWHIPVDRHGADTADVSIANGAYAFRLTMGFSTVSPEDEHMQIHNFVIDRRQTHTICRVPDQCELSTLNDVMVSTTF